MFVFLRLSCLVLFPLGPFFRGCSDLANRLLWQVSMDGAQPGARLVLPAFPGTGFPTPVFTPRGSAESFPARLLESQLPTEHTDHGQHPTSWLLSPLLPLPMTLAASVTPAHLAPAVFPKATGCQVLGDSPGKPHPRPPTACGAEFSTWGGLSSPCWPRGVSSAVAESRHRLGEEAYPVCLPLYSTLTHISWGEWSQAPQPQPATPLPAPRYCGQLGVPPKSHTPNERADLTPFAGILFPHLTQAVKVKITSFTF